MPDIAIVWFRQDLRLADNPALAAAAARYESLVPLYIDSPQESGQAALGGAARWWLHHSLPALGQALQQRGSRLLLRQGPSLPVLQAVIAATGAEAVFWNRLYEPAHIVRDSHIGSVLRQQGVVCEAFNGSLLFEPWQVQTGAGRPYRVFTPFWRALHRRGIPREAAPAPDHLPPVPSALTSEPLEALALLPRLAWDAGLRETWSPGEAAAQARLACFCKEGLQGYQERRDLPGEDSTSMLSPRLHHGELSPRQVVAAVLRVREASRSDAAEGVDAFLAELGWREFGYHLLYHFPEMTERPMDRRFEAFPWAGDHGEVIKAWQAGRTGIPMVDAGMRQLWRTGWMHNRNRMIAASLLTKNLLVPWQIGERWFWDTLVDADLASNCLGWQWTAGCGTDATPFFRIFNPVTQAQRFDPERTYLRRWVPELAQLPDRWIHRPWQAPARSLQEAGVRLDETYPRPVIDLQESRARALAAFETVKGRRR